MSEDVNASMNISSTFEGCKLDNVATFQDNISGHPETVNTSQEGETEDISQEREMEDIDISENKRTSETPIVPVSQDCQESEETEVVSSTLILEEKETFNSSLNSNSVVELEEVKSLKYKKNLEDTEVVSTSEDVEMNDGTEARVVLEASEDSCSGGSMHIRVSEPFSLTEDMELYLSENNSEEEKGNNADSQTDSQRKKLIKEVMSGQDVITSKANPDILELSNQGTPDDVSDLHKSEDSILSNKPSPTTLKNSESDNEGPIKPCQAIDLEKQLCNLLPRRGRGRPRKSSKKNCSAGNNSLKNNIQPHKTNSNMEKEPVNVDFCKIANSKNSHDDKFPCKRERKDTLAGKELESSTKHACKQSTLNTLTPKDLINQTLAKLMSRNNNKSQQKSSSKKQKLVVKEFHQSEDENEKETGNDVDSLTDSRLKKQSKEVVSDQEAITREEDPNIFELSNQGTPAKVNDLHKSGDKSPLKPDQAKDKEQQLNSHQPKRRGRPPGSFKKKFSAGNKNFPKNTQPHKTNSNMEKELTNLDFHKITKSKTGSQNSAGENLPGKSETMDNLSETKLGSSTNNVYKNTTLNILTPKDLINQTLEKLMSRNNSRLQQKNSSKGHKGVGKDIPKVLSINKGETLDISNQGIKKNNLPKEDGKGNLQKEEMSDQSQSLTVKSPRELVYRTLEKLTCRKTPKTMEETATENDNSQSNTEKLLKTKQNITNRKPESSPNSNILCDKSKKELERELINQTLTRLVQHGKHLKSNKGQIEAKISPNASLMKSESCLVKNQRENALTKTLLMKKLRHKQVLTPVQKGKRLTNETPSKCQKEELPNTNNFHESKLEITPQKVLLQRESDKKEKPLDQATGVTPTEPELDIGKQLDLKGKGFKSNKFYKNPEISKRNKEKPLHKLPFTNKEMLINRKKSILQANRKWNKKIKVDRKKLPMGITAESHIKSDSLITPSKSEETILEDKKQEICDRFLMKNTSTHISKLKNQLKTDPQVILVDFRKFGLSTPNNKNEYKKLTENKKNLILKHNTCIQNQTENHDVVDTGEYFTQLELSPSAKTLSSSQQHSVVLSKKHPSIENLPDSLPPGLNNAYHRNMSSPVVEKKSIVEEGSQVGESIIIDADDLSISQIQCPTKKPSGVEEGSQSDESVIIIDDHDYEIPHRKPHELKEFEQQSVTSSQKQKSVAKKLSFSVPPKPSAQIKSLSTSPTQKKTRFVESSQMNESIIINIESDIVKETPSPIPLAAQNMQGSKPCSVSSILTSTSDATKTCQKDRGFKKVDFHSSSRKQRSPVKNVGTHFTKDKKDGQFKILYQPPNTPQPQFILPTCNVPTPNPVQQGIDFVAVKPNDFLQNKIPSSVVKQSTSNKCVPSNKLYKGPVQKDTLMKIGSPQLISSNSLGQSTVNINAPISFSSTPGLDQSLKFPSNVNFTGPVFPQKTNAIASGSKNYYFTPLFVLDGDKVVPVNADNASQYSIIDSNAAGNQLNIGCKSMGTNKSSPQLVIDTKTIKPMTAQDLISVLPPSAVSSPIKSIDVDHIYTKPNFPIINDKMKACSSSLTLASTQPRSKNAIPKSKKNQVFSYKGQSQNKLNQTIVHCSSSTNPNNDLNYLTDSKRKKYQTPPTNQNTHLDQTSSKKPETPAKRKIHLNETEQYEDTFVSSSYPSNEIDGSMSPKRRKCQKTKTNCMPAQPNERMSEVSSSNSYELDPVNENLGNLSSIKNTTKETSSATLKNDNHLSSCQKHTSKQLKQKEESLSTHKQNDLKNIAKDPQNESLKKFKKRIKSKEEELEECLDGVPPFIQQVFKCENIRDGFDNKDLIFVLSLLPDIEEMTNTQRVIFQSKAVKILNDVFTHTKYQPSIKSE